MRARTGSGMLGGMSTHTGPPPLVTESRPCLVCGFDLVGLPVAGVCPECGQPVQRSLQGNLLCYSSPGYIALLHRGVFLVQTSIIAQILGFILMILLVAVLPAIRGSAGPNWNIPAHVAGVIASLGGLAGWWLLSSPDPAYSGANSGGTARRVVRITVAVHACTTILYEVFGSFNPAAVSKSTVQSPQSMLVLVAYIVSIIAWVAWFFAAMRYVQWLAPRLPDEKVYRRAKLLMWLGPVLYTVGSMVCIGPLVALVLYYNLLDWIRSDLRAAREQGASLPPVPPARPA